MAHLLVVDDEENIRRLLKMELQEEGHTVTTAAGGEKAIELFQQGGFDLVCLDIRMPGTDGLEILGRIRDIDMKVPIIVLTAFSDYKQDFSVWSADAYLEKTQDLTELKAKVKELLSQKGPANAGA